MTSIVGLGFVGSALFKSFQLKNIHPLIGYDKYKDGGTGCLEDCLETPILFVCLPTPYNDDTKSYDKSSIFDTMERLEHVQYQGVVVLKSTVEPGTTEELSTKHPSLAIVHNPEFLSAATAFEDFHNQKHVVIGTGSNCSREHITKINKFYSLHYPDADISMSRSIESESMKSFVNCFYAVKIQFFNELYLLCQHNDSDFNTIRDLMLKNRWINPMHTSVPGRDGKLSYGGGCFPKDTNALLQCMKVVGTPHAVLESCVLERNRMRNCEGADNNNNNNNNNNIPKMNETLEKQMNGKEKNLIKNICGHAENGHVVSNTVYNKQ